LVTDIVTQLPPEAAQALRAYPEDLIDLPHEHVDVLNAFFGEISNTEVLSIAYFTAVSSHMVDLDVPISWESSRGTKRWTILWTQVWSRDFSRFVDCLSFSTLWIFLSLCYSTSCSSRFFYQSMY
jgi:hypothetical protein